MFIIIDITVCSRRRYLLGEDVPWPLVSVQTCHFPYADSFLFLRTSVQLCMWMTAKVQGFGVSFLFLESTLCQQCLARHLFLNGFLPASAWWQSEWMAALTALLWSTAATKKKVTPRMLQMEPQSCHILRCYDSSRQCRKEPHSTTSGTKPTHRSCGRIIHTRVTFAPTPVKTITLTGFHPLTVGIYSWVTFTAFHVTLKKKQTSSFSILLASESW